MSESKELVKKTKKINLKNNEVVRPKNVDTERKSGPQTSSNDETVLSKGKNKKGAPKTENMAVGDEIKKPSKAIAKQFVKG